MLTRTAFYVDIGYCTSWANAVACCFKQHDMKRCCIHIIIITAACGIISCGSAATKADQEESSKKEVDQPGDTGTAVMQPDTHQLRSDAPGAVSTRSAPTGENEIIAHIDRYLVSTASFDPAPSPGIHNGILKLENTLRDISFQKVWVQANVLSDKNEVLRSDFYSFSNLEPGETDSQRLPEYSQGVKIEAFVIKVKSEQLTNGETLVVGKNPAGK